MSGKKIRLKKPAEAPKPALVTFEAYCNLKSIHQMHRPALKTYTDKVKATVEEWDKAFEGYY